jgi:ORF6N domain
MVDSDLAKLYGVQTKALNQAVKRNRHRFPADFMFQLTLEEGKAILALRSQNVTLNRGKKGRHLKYAPHVFTEHGTVMLANVLKSDVAVRASIQVVRAFVHLRQAVATNERIARTVEVLELRVDKHDGELQEVLRILRELLAPPPEPPKRPIGFIPSRSEKR